MVTLIIDSCCDFVKTSEWTPLGGLNAYRACIGKNQLQPIMTVYMEIFIIFACILVTLTEFDI